MQVETEAPEVLPKAEIPEPAPGILAKAGTVAKLSWMFGPTALKAAISHYALGPQHPSWPLQTSILVPLIRQATSARAPRDPNGPPIDTIKEMQASRRRMDGQGIMPVPKNGFTADVDVPVRKENLPGVLEELDSAETGKRVVEAEWVVHELVFRKGASASPRVCLYLHGGAYIVMSRKSHRALAIAMSKAIDGRVLNIDYRLAPEAPFPAALQDAVSSYLYLTQELHIPASNIYVAGDSAGGGLAAALVLYLRDHQFPTLGGAILLCPWVDSTASLTSWNTNAVYDYLGNLNSSPEPAENPMDPMRLYLGQGWPSLLTHPYVLSCAADMHSLPPLLIQSGSYEVLHDEGVLFALRAAKAGVDVSHQVYEGGVHVFQSFISTELARTALRSVSEWVERRPAPTSCGFARVDEVIQKAWEALPEGLRAAVETQGKKEKVEKAQPFIFVGAVRAPKVLELKPTANEAVRKAVEELANDGETAVSSFYSATPARGTLAKLKGMLHL